jgi:hypothetical protein
VTEEVKRNYLEINSLQDLIEGNKPSEDYSLSLINPINFQLNKFFYKNIGKKHKWVDRLTWSEEKWINYASSKEMVGLIKGINTVAKKLGISTEVGKGYRALANISDHGGQEVPHLHFHLFGGERVGKMVE